MSFKELNNTNKALELYATGKIKKASYYQTCCICNYDIKTDQYYYDEGKHRRAHQKCVDKLVDLEIYGEKN